jgi:hypothetical protein
MGNVQTAQSGDPAPSTSQVSHPQNPPKRPRLAVERELQQPLHIEVKKVKLFKSPGCDHMVVGFATSCAISAYQCCEFESH